MPRRREPSCQAGGCASSCRASTIGAAATSRSPSRACPEVLTAMKLLFIGDICGRPGRELIRRGLAALVAHHGADLVIANVENAAAGFGITPDLADDLSGFGIAAMTTGNHVWDKKEIYAYIASEPRLIRPANYPAGAPGNGSVVVRSASGVTVGVVNIMGRVFMTAIDDPFAIVLREVEAVKREAAVVLVDFHAEATDRKSVV